MKIPNVVDGPEWVDAAVLVLTAPIWLMVAGFVVLLAATPWLHVYWTIKGGDDA